jgi:hypothetical protein
LVSFTRRHAPLIAAVAVISGGIGCALSLRHPNRYIASGIFQTATLSNGALESLDVVFNNLTSALDEAAAAGELPPAVAYTLAPVLGPLPNLDGTPLFEIRAQGSSEKDVRTYVQIAERELLGRQAPLASQEQAHAEAYLSTVEQDLESVFHSKFSKESHDLIVKLIRERADAERTISPARILGPKLIGVHVSLESTRPDELASAALAGLMIGGLLGYAAGFFFEARRPRPVAHTAESART